MTSPGLCDYMVFDFRYWTDSSTRSGEEGKINTYRYVKSNKSDLNEMLAKGWKLCSDKEEWQQEGESGVILLKLYKEKG